jgi:hypothetical protein
MPTRAAKQFNAELSELFRARTHELRNNMWPSMGSAPRLTQKRIKRSIRKLQQIAETDFLRSKETRKIINGYDYKRQWHSKKGKGFGRQAKKRSFKEWYDRKVTTKNCVYIFWNGSHSLYVGRTLNGKGRPTAHFEKHWFGQAKRVDVYGFDRKRDVPRFECMMTHKHEPSYSRMKPSSKKYYATCPICDRRDFIRDQIRWLFRLR